MKRSRSNNMSSCTWKINQWCTILPSHFLEIFQVDKGHFATLAVTNVTLGILNNVLNDHSFVNIVIVNSNSNDFDHFASVVESLLSCTFQSVVPWKLILCFFTQPVLALKLTWNKVWKIVWIYSFVYLLPKNRICTNYLMTHTNHLDIQVGHD